MFSRSTSILLVALSSLFLFACGTSEPPAVVPDPDAGRPGDDASIIADAGTDAPPELDAGADGGPPVLPSLVHVLFIGGAPGERHQARDETGRPLALTSGASWGGDLLLCEESTCWVVDPDTGAFTSEQELRTVDGALVSPDLLFTGDFGAGETLISIEGSRARQYDAATGRFANTPFDLIVEDPTTGVLEPFVPRTIDLVDLGTGPILVAFRVDDDGAYVLGTDLVFRRALPSLVDCMYAATLHPDLFVSITPAAADVFVVTREQYVLALDAARLPGQICFNLLPAILGDIEGRPYLPDFTVGHLETSGRKLVVFTETQVLEP